MKQNILFQKNYNKAQFIISGGPPSQFICIELIKKEFENDSKS
jgi:hypothetical protein